MLTSNINGIPSVICSLFLLFLGALVFVSNRCKTNFLFFCLTLSAAIWQIGTALTILSATPEIAFFWTKFSYIGVTFIPVTMFHFTISLLGRKGFDKYIVLSYLTALLIFVPLSWLNVFLDGVYQYPWGYWFKATTNHPLYILFYSLLFFVSLFLLSFAYRDKNRQDRHKIQYLLVALFISYGGVLDYLPDYGINIYPIGYIFVAICLSIIAYAITKHHLMDISVVISCTAAHVLTTALLGLVYLGFVLSYRTYISVNIDLGLFIGTLIYGVYVGEYFQKIRLHIQTTAEKLILRGRYDYSKVLRQTSQDLSRAMTLDEINEVVKRDLREYMDVSKARIMVLR